jgi:hypothetical protein
VLKRRWLTVAALAAFAIACGEVFGLSESITPPPDSGSVAVPDGAQIVEASGAVRNIALATVAGEIRELAIAEDGDLFFTTRAPVEVGFLPKGSGPPLPLIVSGLDEPTRGLTIDGERIYVAGFRKESPGGSGQNAVQSILRDGGSPQVFLTCGSGLGVAVSSTTIYWARFCNDEAALSRLSKTVAGSAALSNAFGDGEHAEGRFGQLTIIGANLYTTSKRAIHFLARAFQPRPNSPLTMLLDVGGEIAGMVAHGNKLYLQVDTKLVVVDPNAAPPTLTPLGRVPPQQASEGSVSLAVDDAYVYVASSAAQAILRAPKDGSSPDSDAAALMTDPDTPTAVSVDAKEVYYGTKKGTIWRVAK